MKKLKPVILVLLFLLAVTLLTACGSENFSGKISVKKTGSISGQVLDKTSGELLAGVNIEVAGKNDTTNSEGSFYINELETGEHLLIVSKDNYQSRSFNIVVMEGSNSLENKIELTPAGIEVVYGKVKGVVQNETGKYLSDAKVSISNMSVMTDENGSFELSNIPKGSYVLEIKHNNYQALKMDIEITDVEEDMGIIILNEKNNDIYYGKDYFINNVGYGIRYNVTGSDYSDYWGVFQSNDGHKFSWTFSPTSNNLELVRDSESYTYTTGWYFDDFISFSGSSPNSTPGNLLALFKIPKVFNFGDSWIDHFGMNYSIEKAEALTLAGVTFSDTIKVNIEYLDDGFFEDVRGKGYYILAKDIGIVKMVFNRKNGTNVVFEYSEKRYFNRNSISGKVVDGDIALSDVILSQSNFVRDRPYTLTDNQGNFSFNFYGPTTTIFLGYDENNDDRIDYENTATPNLGYNINNVNSDITGVVIDVQNFWD